MGLSDSRPYAVAGGFYIGDDVEVHDVKGLDPPVYGRVMCRDFGEYVKVMLDNGCGYVTLAENLTRVEP
jgi:hypothetical protein